MGWAFYRGLYMFFAVGAAISFLPTILLAWDMNSLAWQISIGAMITNAGMVIGLALLDGLYQASKNFPPATMLTFASLALGAAAGLILGGIATDYWYLIAAPAFLAILSGIISGSAKKAITH